MSHTWQRVTSRRGRSATIMLAVCALSLPLVAVGIVKSQDAKAQTADYVLNLPTIELSNDGFNKVADETVPGLSRRADWPNQRGQAFAAIFERLKGSNVDFSTAKGVNVDVTPKVIGAGNNVQYSQYTGISTTVTMKVPDTRRKLLEKNETSAGQEAAAGAIKLVTVAYARAACGFLMQTAQEHYPVAYDLRQSVCEAAVGGVGSVVSDAFLQKNIDGAAAVRSLFSATASAFGGAFQRATEDEVRDPVAIAIRAVHKTLWYVASNAPWMAANAWYKAGLDKVWANTSDLWSKWFPYVPHCRAPAGDARPADCPAV